MSAQLEAYCATKPLREYQHTACAAVSAHLDAGRITLLVAPTGAGKSRMSAEIMRPATKGIVLTHTTILREQSKATLPGCSVATIQSLVAKGQAGDWRRAQLKDFDFFFVDEAHHLVGEEWVKLVPYMRHGKLFGATATPQRADGTPLGDVFETLVSAARYSYLVHEGFLVPCDVAKPKLSRAQQKKQKVKVDGVQSYIDLARREGTNSEYRPGIYFAPTIAECDGAVYRFADAGIRAAVVSCEVTGEWRQDIFDAYSRGDLDMLCSPMALSEGFDSPRAEVCVLNRSCASIATYIQMVGRVLRPCPGKDRALLIDCTDAASVHGLPTADRNYSLLGAGIVEAIEEDTEQVAREHAEREAWQLVRIEYELVRDNLKAKFVNIQQEATDKGRAKGWVFCEFKRAIQSKDDRGFVSEPFKVPRILEAKRASVCAHCRHRVAVGSTILWDGPSKVLHQDCYFETLTDEQLVAYKASVASGKQHG